MTLGDFLSAFDGDNVLITLADADDEIIRFYGGTTALDNGIEARTIRNIKMTMRQRKN